MSIVFKARNAIKRRYPWENDLDAGEVTRQLGNVDEYNIEVGKKGFGEVDRPLLTMISEPAIEIGLSGSGTLERNLTSV